MAETLAGRTALVTGGAVRIGRAIALALAAEGAAVVVHYRRSGPAARRLCAAIARGGGKAWPLRADLDDPAACAALVGRARRLAGPLDLLVNNAAVFHRDTLDTLDAGSLAAEFRTDLFAPLLLMKAFAAQRRPGRIVNVLDRRITGLDPARVPYVLAKKALAEATRIAARHWAPRIAVNAVAPGPVLPPPGRGPDYLREKAGPIPLGRPVALEDVAGAVLFLLRSASTTGQVLFVDGGQHLLGSDPLPPGPAPRAGGRGR